MSADSPAENPSSIRNAPTNLEPSGSLIRSTFNPCRLPRSEVRPHCPHDPVLSALRLSRASASPAEADLLDLSFRSLDSNAAYSRIQSRSASSGLFPGR